MPTRRNIDADEGQQALARALAMVAEGNQAALRDLFERTSAKLKGICVRILRNDTEAEDVLQEVYVTVWRRAGSFDPSKGGASNWLVTIARNSAIDRLRFLRIRSGHGPIEDAMTVPSDDPDAFALADAKQESARIHHCLSVLEPRARKAIRVAFFEGLSYPEIAAGSGMPLGTIKSLIRRGLIRLRDCLRHD